MVDMKAFLPSSMQTKKEGGSSATHPLATAGQHPGDPEYEARNSRGDGKGEEGYGLADSANAREAHEGYTRDASDPSVMTGAVGATGASKHPDQQQQMGSARRPEEEMGSGRRAEDIASARQEHVEDREAQQQRQMDSSHGGTGLEQRDPYAAGAQAGGLLDEEDIRRIDQETVPRSAAGGVGGEKDVAPQIGGTPESGFISQMGPPAGQYSSTGGQGLQSLDAAQMSSGTAGGQMAGQAGDQMTSAAPGMGGSGGQEGLIHGHHTTKTGEMLDPHIGQQ